jgi:hypothetical protein
MRQRQSWQNITLNAPLLGLLYPRVLKYLNRASDISTPQVSITEFRPKDGNKSSRLYTKKMDISFASYGIVGAYRILIFMRADFP